MEKNFLTAAEAMAYLSVSRNTLKKLIADGFIPEPARLGSRLLRFDRSEIDKYLRGSNDEKEDDPSGRNNRVQEVE
jgi:excisionase family DNA binding protein